MKKLMFFLLLTGTISAYGQNGYNGYYGGGSCNTGTQVYGNHTSRPVYSNNNYGNSCAPAQQSRVRWEASQCGHYRWRIEERAYWVPGQFVWHGGCRTWQDGYWDWRVVRREKKYDKHHHGHHHGHKSCKHC